MTAGVTIETRELGDLSAFFKRLPEIADQAARMAVNDAARLARREGAKHILDEVNYPKNYLNGDAGRLNISKYATNDDLTAEVSGRDRPTSLARFRMQAVKFGRQSGIRVQVARQGGSKTMTRAFFLKLRRGVALDGDNFNVGLAVRLKKGETLRNSTRAVPLRNNVWLLYGPSVDQVFAGVADDIVDEVSDSLESQFIRQFERLSNGQ